MSLNADLIHGKVPEIENEITTHLENFRLGKATNDFRILSRQLCIGLIFSSANPSPNDNSIQQYLENLEANYAHILQQFEDSQSSEEERRNIISALSKMTLGEIRKRYSFWRDLSPNLIKKGTLIGQLTSYRRYLGQFKKDLLESGDLGGPQPANVFALPYAIYPTLGIDRLSVRDDELTSEKYTTPDKWDKTHFTVTKDAKDISRLSLESKTVERLRELRSKILSVLDQLAKSTETVLSEGGIPDFRTRNEHILSDALLASDVDFLLSFDKSIASTVTRSTQDTYRKVRKGSLSNILHVLGHIEKEETIGTFRSMLALLDKRGLKGGRTNPLSLVANVSTDLFKESIALFNENAAKEKHFWREFQSYINSFIQNGLYEELTTKNRVRRSATVEFTTSLDTFAKYLQAKMDAEANPLVRSYLSESASSSPASPTQASNAEFYTLPNFKSTSDFKNITCNGANFSLTAEQARVIAILFDSFTNDIPYVHQESLRPKEETVEFRMDKLFKNVSNLDKLLKRNPEKRASWGLNIVGLPEKKNS